jgi:hypothetical protein
MKQLPGINIQYPISRRILDRTKTIETRTYPLPDQYKGKGLYLVETPGPSETFRARIVGVVRFSGSFRYHSREAFYADYKRHLVNEDSPYAWRNKPRWGWVIERVVPIEPAVEAPSRRGIVFTKVICP